jgi:hypothetical protein
MKALLIKAWHDPVGSKVISTLIVAALGAMVLWAKSGFSSSLAVVWTSTVAVWSWLAGPMTLPIGIVLLTLVIFAALGWRLITQHRRALVSLEKHWLTRTVKAAADAETKVRDELERVARVAEIEKIKQPRLITFQQAGILQRLYVRYREGMEIRLLAHFIDVDYPVAEKLCEELAGIDFVKMVPGMYGPATVYLSTIGRDYVLKHDLAAQ